MQKISIIIPVYNEDRTIKIVLDKIINLNLINEIQKEVIIIDDCSNDNSREIILQFIDDHKLDNIKYFEQPINKGKGAAVRRGFENSTGEYIVIQDADLELNPIEINALIKANISGEGNVIYGSRFLEKKYENVNFMWHIFGNKMLTKITNLFTGLHLTDMMTCYKLIPKKAIDSITLIEDGFGIEPELTIKLSKLDWITFHEISITYSARNRTEGKKINYKNGIRVMFSIIKYSFF